MKKVIQFILALAVLFFLYQFLVTFFINKHEITYQISTVNNTFQVREQFLKEKKNHYYSFQVFDKNQTEFTFYYDKNYNKQKKILKELEVYQENGVYCLLPIFKDKKPGGVVCRYQEELVSYDYLKEQGISLENWKNSLQEKGYVLDSADAVAEEEKVTLYNHFPKNYTLTLWNYHGLYIVNNDTVKNLEILENDHYENTHGILVGNQYVIADTDPDFEFNRIYLINVLGPSEDFIDLDVTISQDSYFLGTVDNNVYIMDRDQKKEYAFDVKTKKIKEVGNKEENAQMYNGKWYTENIYTVSDQKQKFVVKKTVPEIENLYHPKWAIESINKYYFGNEDGKVYYVMKDRLQSKVLLFQNKNLKDLKVIGDDLFFLSGADIIHYNLVSGYHKIVTHSELLYNNQNIFDVIEKS